MSQTNEKKVDTRTLKNPELLSNHLDHFGLALFEGQLPDQVLAAFRAIAQPLAHRDSSNEKVTRLRYRPDVAGEPGYDGFTRDFMPPHTDGSGMATPPELVGIVCVKAATSGGAALLVDATAALIALMNRHPSALAALSRGESAAFGAELNRYAVLDRKNGRHFVRYREDGLANYDAVYNEVADFREALQDHLIEVDLPEGSGYILQNGRWLHGRRSFTGDREMLRLLGRSRRDAGASRIRFGFDLPVDAKMTTTSTS